MTKKILTGLTLATILFTIGISSQSFAMPMADKTQSDILAASTGNLTFNGQQYELIGIPSTHKGGTSTYQLMLKPVEGPDSITPAQPADAHPLIQVATTTHKGDASAYQWVPQPDPNPKDFVS